MIAGIFARCGKPVDKKDLPFAAVFHSYPHELLLPGDRQMDQPLVLILYFCHALKSVVQRVAEENADIRRFEKSELLAVRNAGQRNAGVLALDGFRSEKHVQRFIAGLVLRLIAFDLLLHLIEIAQLVFRRNLRAQQVNLVFQVMILPVYKLNALRRKAVILFLHMQQFMEIFLFHPGIDLAKLQMIGKEKSGASQIRQRAQSKNIRDIARAEGGIRRGITQIAQKINKAAHQVNDHQISVCALQLFVALSVFILKQPGNAEYRRMAHKEKSDFSHRVFRDSQNHSPVIQHLPLKRRGKFSEDKGSHGEIQHFSHRHFRSCENIKKYQVENHAHGEQELPAVSAGCHPHKGC